MDRLKILGSSVINAGNAMAVYHGKTELIPDGPNANRSVFNHSLFLQFIFMWKSPSIPQVFLMVDD